MTAIAAGRTATGLLEACRRFRSPQRPSGDFLGHNEHLKGRPRLQRIHEAQKAWPLLKDVRLVDAPAFPHGIGAGVLDLACDRRCFGGNGFD
jgi:hypothetical protein